MPWRVALESETGGERWLDTPGYAPTTPLDPMHEPAAEPYFVTSADQLRADLDRRRTDAALLITDRFIGLAASQSPEYAVAIAAAYNRYLRERWLDPSRGLFGAILVAGQDPTAAADEIRAYAGSPGVKAGLLSTVNVVPLWGDDSYEPIFAAAAETGLPLVLHGANVYGSLFPYELQSFESPLARGALAQPLGAIVNLVSLVTNGVLARHPGLKLLFCEAGVSWLGFITGRLDGQYRHLQRELPEPPSAYVSRQVWTTTHPLERAALTPTLSQRERGNLSKRILFASNWPHFDHDESETLTRLLRAGGQASNIMGQNAKALFALA